MLLTVYMSIESEFPRSAAQLRKAVVRGPDALAMRMLHGRGRERGRETGMWRAAVGKGGGRTPLPLALPLDTNSQGCPKRCRSDLTERSNSRRKPSRKGNINFRFCSRPQFPPATGPCHIFLAKFPKGEKVIDHFSGSFKVPRMCKRVF